MPHCHSDDRRNLIKNYYHSSLAMTDTGFISRKPYLCYKAENRNPLWKFTI